MSKQGAHHSSHLFTLYLYWTKFFIFYGLIGLGILTTNFPPIPEQAFTLRKLLATNQNSFFKKPGAGFEAFKPFLPSLGTISVIMDTPYRPQDTRVEPFCAAQNYLAPLILTPYPTEKIALIYCSNLTVANRRLNETGYKSVKTIGNGKAVAIKKT